MSVFNDPTEIDELFEDFESNNLEECLNYYKETKEIEPLEFAIADNKLKIETAIDNIQLLIDVARSTKNSYMANQLIQIKTNLKKDLWTI
jgi:hypothetical protein